jgi:retron-type reverse transcriptase
VSDGFLTIIACVLIVCAIIVLYALINKPKRRFIPPTPYRPPVIPPIAPSRPATRAPQGPPPQNVILNLDVGAFKPLGDAETKQAAVGLQWGAFAFGLRSQIPPASDPRTGIIDRAMVGQGIITPEELVEIHKIGEAMDALRPQSAHVQALADAAVAREKMDRAQLKEQKKAEAAERMRLHAEAVAKRKATDIIFLGRGVSKGLADRRTNVEKLQQLGLPVLATPADVATALGMTIPKLRWLAFHSDASMTSHYIRFTIPKRSGGVRQLAAPHEYLATAQEWILTNVLEKIPTNPAANGFVTGKSTVTNATPHVKRDIVLNCDLVDFFPSITFHRVAGIFRQLGYSPAVATILALICTESPRREVIYAGQKLYVASGPRALPQGACTSPALSNLAARRLDSRLAGIARKLGWDYTRYADDMTFSAAGELSQKIGYLLARIRHITADEGFSVNEAKTRVQRRHMAQSVTGIIVNDHPSPGRELVRRVRAILHRAKHEGLKAQNRENLPHFDAWLVGTIAYISMIDARKGEALKRAYAEVSG